MGFKIPKAADGSYDIGNMTEAVSPNIAANAVNEGNVATLKAYYDQLANPRLVDPAARAKVAGALIDLRHQMGLADTGDIEDGKLLNDYTPMQRGGRSRTIRRTCDSSGSAKRIRNPTMPPTTHSEQVSLPSVRRRKRLRRPRVRQVRAMRQGIRQLRHCVQSSGSGQQKPRGSAWRTVG